MKKIALTALTFALSTIALAAHADPTTPDSSAATVASASATGAHASSGLHLATEAEPALPIGWVVGISVALAAAVLFVHLKKQGTGKGASKDPIRVLAQKQLGPKAKIVLVETRGREILLSVGDRGATLVSDWWVDDEKKDEEALAARSLDDVAIDDPIELADMRPSHREERSSAKPAPAPSLSLAPAPVAAAPIAVAPSPTASAVSGLMRLRTKSSVRAPKPTAQKPTAQKPSATKTAPAPHMDLASDLYGQWSKHLMSR